MSVQATRNAFCAAVATAGAMLLLLHPVRAFAETRTTGVVTDQESHQPVAGAAVAIEGERVRATTDEAGRFTLISQRPFARLVVTRVGYARKVVDVADPAQPLAIELALLPVPQSAFEVTGRSVSRPQLDVAQSAATLTTQDLQRGDGLELENSINTLPGVIMQSRTPWGGAHIQIRGYYPNFSQNSNGFGDQTFIDGVPITDATGQTTLDDVDFTSLGRVEVINGPASSLYGASIAGTVNYYTLEPAPGVSGLTQQTVGGSDGLFRTNTTYSTAGDHSAVALNYGHQTYDSFRPDSRSKKDFARFNGEFKAGPKQTLSTYFSYNNSYEQLAGEIDGGDFVARQAINNPVYALNNSQIDIESQRAGVTHDVRYNDALGQTSTVFATTQVMHQPFAHGYNDYNRFSFGARSALDANATAGAVRIDGKLGAFFQRTNYTTNGFFIPSSRPSDQENYAMNYYGFTEWNAAFPGQVIATVGGVLSMNEFGIRNMLTAGAITNSAPVYRRAFDPEFTPRASLLKRFRDELSVYGSVSTGFTPPSLSSIINSDNSINTKLKPESGTQYEVGTKGSLLSHRASYTLALFDLEVTDKLVSQKIGAVTSTTNVGKQRDQGAELTLSDLLLDQPKGMISQLRPWLSYSYSDFKYVEFKSDANNNASTVDFSGNQVARTPKNVINIGVDARSRTGAYLYASYQHVDAIYVTFDNSTKVPPYRLVSAKLGWEGTVARNWTLDVSLGGDNLTNTTYYKFVFVGPNYAGLAQAKDGGTGDGYILPGPYDAKFYGGARLTYNF